MTNAHNNSVYLQISAGQGPKECGWVVARLAETILRESEQQKVKVEWCEHLAFEKQLRNQDLLEIDAYKSVLLRVTGENKNQFVARWSGTIKWQGESPYRSRHKRLNWFVGVSTFDPSNFSVADIDQIKKELAFESIRSGGPGGQHVNKTNSAIRLRHTPTGITVREESSRSQHTNKRLAVERLQMMLLAQQSKNKKADVKNQWTKHYQVQRGNPVRVFEGKKFSEIK